MDIDLCLLMPFLVPSQHVYACSCGPPEPPEVTLEKATAVFSGKVIHETIYPEGERLYFSRTSPFIQKGYFLFGKTTTLEVYETWKGKPYQQIILHMNECGLNMSLDSEWLVYAYGE